MKLYRDEEILACWLRDLLNMSVSQIFEEIKRLRKNPTWEEYKRCRRVGSTFPMNRTIRKRVYDLSVKAIRHEAIEKEIKKSVAFS
jgi:hypothetical protein